MTSISRKIEVFNEAFALAWPRMNARGPMTGRSQFLRDAIQRHLKAGETDAAKIAETAVAEFADSDDAGDPFPGPRPPAV